MRIFSSSTTEFEPDTEIISQSSKLIEKEKPRCLYITVPRTMNLQHMQDKSNYTYQCEVSFGNSNYRFNSLKSNNGTCAFTKPEICIGFGEKDINSKVLIKILREKDCIGVASFEINLDLAQCSRSQLWLKLQCPQELRLQGPRIQVNITVKKNSTKISN